AATGSAVFSGITPFSLPDPAGMRLNEIIVSSAIPRQTFSTQPGGTADASTATGPARLSAALRRLGRRMALGSDSSPGPAAQLLLHLRGLPANDAAAGRGDRQLPDVPVLRLPAVAPVPGNRHAVRRIADRAFEPDHENRFPRRSGPGFDFSFLADPSPDRDGHSARHRGDFREAQREAGPAADLHGVHRPAGDRRA